METIIKHFTELTAEELYDILKLRVAVFVVEQNCPYQELDDYDKGCYHVFFRDENGIAAYMRVLDKGRFDDASFGRVISARRRRGLGTKLLKVGVDVAKEKYHAQRIVIGAQSYARPFYEQAGFVHIEGTDEYLEDGIPHIYMEMRL